MYEFHRLYKHSLIIFVSTSVSKLIDNFLIPVFSCLPLKIYLYSTLLHQYRYPPHLFPRKNLIFQVSNLSSRWIWCYLWRLSRQYLFFLGCWVIHCHWLLILFSPDISIWKVVITYGLATEVLAMYNQECYSFSCIFQAITITPNRYGLIDDQLVSIHGLRDRPQGSYMQCYNNIQSILLALIYNILWRVFSVPTSRHGQIV